MEFGFVRGGEGVGGGEEFEEFVGGGSAGGFECDFGGAVEDDVFIGEEEDAVAGFEGVGAVGGEEDGGAVVSEFTDGEEEGGFEFGR